MTWLIYYLLFQICLGQKSLVSGNPNFFGLLKIFLGCLENFYFYGICLPAYQPYENFKCFQKQDIIFFSA